MEVTKRENRRFQLKSLREFFMGEKKPFVEKREVNWAMVVRLFLILLGLAIGWILVMPSPKEVATSFHEKVDSIKTPSEQKNEMTPTDETVNQMSQGKTDSKSIPRSLDYLYTTSGGVGGAGGSVGNGRAQNGSMILTRGGLDTHTQLPPGTRMRVRLLQNVTVANQAIPVIGLVSADVPHEDGLAIEAGAKLYGDVSFDEALERGSIAFRSIRFSDGRERQISGLAMGLDGQGGVEGKVHSEGIKNAIGQTLTRFIGAYAEGSMQQGSFGAQPGGASNGLKNAIAETAKDRAEALGKNLSEERKWLEIQSGTEFMMVLNQPFTFREPGAIHGN